MTAKAMAAAKSEVRWWLALLVKTVRRLPGHAAVVVGRPLAVRVRRPSFGLRGHRRARVGVARLGAGFSAALPANRGRTPAGTVAASLDPSALGPARCGMRALADRAPVARRRAREVGGGAASD